MNLIIKGRLSRWVVVFVVLGMLMQPIQQVLAVESVAQETLDTTVEPIDPLSSEETTGGETVKTEEEAATKETTTEEETKIEEAPVEEETSPEVIPEPPAEPNVQLPPSTIKQKVADADIASGALVYSYQLQVPNGRAGVQPGLALSYNSQQNEEGSLVGYGWGLDIPTIERKNVDGLNKLYTSENFTSSLGGDLKKIDSAQGVSTFGAKIDNGSYLKYSFDSAADNNGGVWTVRDKSGMVYTFGQTAESRLSNPTDASKVFRWHLTRVQDTKGNFVSYGYSKIDNQVYPNTIYYTGNDTDQGIFKVQFNLEDRPDKAMSAKYGFMVTNTKRITEVEVLVQNIVTGRYSLDYGQQSVNHRSQLMRIEYTGFDITGANGISDGGMNFAYNSITATDLLTKITQNTGGVTNITYKSSAQYRDDTGAALNPHLPFAVQTVETIEYDDRNGVTWNNSFEYDGGWFYYNGSMDRRFVGFEKVVRTDSVGNTLTSFYHQGNGNTIAYGEALDDWAKAGKSYKSELRDAQGNLFAQVLNKWEFNRLPGVGGPNDRSFVKLSASVTRTFDGNTSHEDKASTYTYDADTGNLISGIDFGEVDALTDTGSFTDVGNDKLTTTISYASPTGDVNMTGLPSGFIELNQAGNKVKEGKSYYDDLAFGQVGIGNPTKEESWISGSTYAAVSRTFNSFGLPLTETDSRGNTTTYTYDNFNLYPTTVNNALSQAVSYEYDYRLGKPFKTTDANGLVNKISFDGLGRATKEEFTQPGQTNPNLLFTKKTASYELYEQNGEVRGWKTVETNYLDEVTASSPRENKAITYTDGFDRTIQTRSLVESADAAPSDPRYSVSDTMYNNIAQIEKTSLPYFSVGEARTEATADANLLATFSYDSAYRVTTTANVLGTATNAYDDWKVTATDANGKVKVLHKDAFDRLVKVDEHNGSVVYTTKYDYDAEGNLVRMEDALGNEREFEYDGLGRRTEAEDLHAPADQTFGVWSYVYDLAGNLKERTDANGTVVGYVYDQLNRVISEDAGQNKELDVSYSYDSCLKGIGRLCAVTNSAITTSNEYNVLGQLSKETKTINNQAYVTEYSYDRQGNQLILKNPDNSEVKYSYNIGGQIEAVQSKESIAGSFGNVVVDMDYAPTGAVTYQESANGAKVTNTYDAAQLYRLASKVGTLPLAGGGIRTVQNYAYSYDPVGNITQIIDASDLNTRKTTLYSYDDLHRLTWAHTVHAVGGQNYSQIYEYDAIGNITSKSDVGTYSYDGDEGDSYANPHAVTSIAGTTIYSYDHNGNVVDDGSTEYVWDYNNRISSITPDGIISSPINYGYDAGGMRVSVALNNATTAYPSKFYNTSGGVSDTGVQKHIFAGDSLAATIKGSGASTAMFVAQSDHLGSTTVTSDAGGAIAETVDYYPFGSIRQNTSPSGNSEQRKFLGQEYDTNTELSYLEARYYDPSIGRFLSQDPVYLAVGNNDQIKSLTGSELQGILSDPQALNSYTYARNNPLRYVDPDGQFFREKWEEAKQQYNNGVVWVGNKAEQAYQNNAVARYALDHPYQAGVAIGVVGGALVAGGVVAGGGAITCGVLCGGTAATVVGTAAPVAQQVQKNQQQIVAAGNRTLNLTQHALARMTEHGITQQQVTTIAQKGQQFNYLHEGVSKVGYYDPVSKVLVATAKISGNITTVIRNVSQSYVNGLAKTAKQ